MSKKNVSAKSDPRKLKKATKKSPTGKPGAFVRSGEAVQGGEMKLQPAGTAVKLDEALCDSNLKPCPFCGAMARITAWPAPRSELPLYFAQCILCGATGGRGTTLSGAHIGWNRRES